MLFRFARALTCAIVVAGLNGCASSVVTDDSDPSFQYAYRGEKYGVVTVTLSDSLTADPDKSAKLQDVRLDKAIVNHLIKDRAYDKQSRYSVNVVLTSFNFRGTTSAVLWGAFAGTDGMDGVVTLMDPEGKQLAKFDVSTTYGLGGTEGGTIDSRLGWLCGNFANETISTLKGQKVPSPKSAGKR